MISVHQVVTNWKTTAVGILQFVGVLIAVLIALWDGDPETLPNWELLGTSFMGLLGFLAARDGDKSSQDNRLRP